MPTEHTYRIDFEITQPNLILNGVNGVSPTDYAYIVFSQWYKGDKGDPGVGIPQTISLEDNTLTLSDGGGTVTLPDELPSQTGNNGKFLTTDGTDARWEQIPAGNYKVTFSMNGDTITCDTSISDILEAIENDRIVTTSFFIYHGINVQLNASAYISDEAQKLVVFESDTELIDSQTVTIAGVSMYNSENETWEADQWEYQNVKIDYNHLENIPELGTAAALDVAESGNASTTQVVKGDDTRLSDSRNAADVYSWAKAATKPSYSASEVGAIASSEKGANSGVAELDPNGKVPSSQLPSYVDDVLEYASQSAFPATGETGKIYIALDTNKTYRWGGSAYTEISESLALGETSSTAYAGNKGKANADAISAIKDGTTIDSFGDVETALSGKQATIDASHKLSADLISDGSTNKVYKATEQSKLAGIAAGAQVNVKPDWDAASGNAAEILNKPTLGTAAAKDVPASGDATTTQVVMGDDSRLTDARTPTSHTHGNITNDGKVGSASGKILTTGTGGAVQASDSIQKSMISDLPTIPVIKIIDET